MVLHLHSAGYWSEPPARAGQSAPARCSSSHLLPQPEQSKGERGPGLEIPRGAEAAGSQRPFEGKELLKAMGKEVGEVGRMKGIQNTKK